MYRSKAVIGLGFGDEGKGLTTSFLCDQTENPVVVRFNGGHQAGHTVIHEGSRHVFSNFGSGTLQGVPTFWSEFCTFSPIGVLNEYAALKEMGVEPKLHIHPLCPIVTPYDKHFNQAQEKWDGHGSVGVGFGATIRRQERYYKLFAQDILHPVVMRAKVANIAKFYANPDVDMDGFWLAVEAVRDIVTINDNLWALGKNPIYEGAQGILLDMDFGFFPNVTRSNTTLKNAVSINQGSIVDVYYVTRAYQTRHGNGFMTNEGLELDLKHTEHETNVKDEWQGEFRRSVLDIDLLNYSLACDKAVNSNSGWGRKHLVITCADQCGYKIPVTMWGKLGEIHTESLHIYLKTKFDSVITSWGPTINTIQERTGDLHLKRTEFIS